MLATSHFAAANIAKTSLDYMAEGYWQDFIAGHPIAGGIAYKEQLHDYQLDESMVSLQRVDTLISQIRRDIAKVDNLNENTLLADDSYRNLLLFLAFYAGRVLARQWQSEAHWYGRFELRKHYPELSVVADDFYQHMAVNYGDGSDGSAKVFFALEPIGLRLFGHIDRQFQAVQGGQVASGLYQAVSARLPKNRDVAIHNTISESKVAYDSERLNIYPANISKNKGLSKQRVQDTADKSELSTTIEHAKPSIVEAAPSHRADVAGTPADLLTATHQTSKRSIPAPTPEIFTQLLTELNEIDIAQNAGNDDYQEACKILDQFEHHIAQQPKPRNQVQFSEHEQTARKQALTRLQDSALLGNTAAMLRLAMYELLGEGLIASLDDSKEAGVDWVKQAANDKDIRGQRLLSKMYYQGVGVPQDIKSGQYWLEEAAKNGHIEAAELVAAWQQARGLIISQKREHHSIKRYQILIAVVLAAAIFLVIFI